MVFLKPSCHLSRACRSAIIRPSLFLSRRFGAVEHGGSAQAPPSGDVSDTPSQVYVTFYDTFDRSLVDCHLLLLTEAYRKHGVHLLVPHQLPPEGKPPAVPEVLLSAAQQDRLQQLQMPYPPQHGSPPLWTTGARDLSEEPEPEARPKTVAAKAPALASAKRSGLDTAPQKPSSTLPTAKPTTKPSKVVLRLPEEEELQSLLALWDDWGPNLLKQLQASGDPVAQDIIFQKSSDAIFGVADNRKELEDAAPSRATPIGAAPGVKRRLWKRLSASAQKEVHKPMAMRNKEYSNPFGEHSSNRDLMEQASDAKVLNPFRPDWKTLPNAATATVLPSETTPPVPGQPHLPSAAEWRRFACHLCPKAFRLLDGLVDHTLDAHGMDVPEERLRDMESDTRKANPLYVPQVAPMREEGPPGSCHPATPPTPRVLGLQSQSQSLSSSAEDPEDDALRVHFRSHASIVVMGTVQQIETGYINAAAVLQMLISVAGSEKEEGHAGQEQLLVRCWGENNKRHPIRIGMTVMVSGSIKMNLQAVPDTPTAERHAYPYIIVYPPLGSLHVIHSLTNAASR